MNPEGATDGGDPPVAPPSRSHAAEPPTACGPEQEAPREDSGSALAQSSETVCSDELANPALGLSTTPRRLDPRVRVAWILSGLVRCVVLTAAAAAADFAWRPRTIFAAWLPGGAATVAIGSLTLAAAILLPRLRYARWTYALRPQDVLLSFGVFWRVQRSIPRLRIQHVDVVQGPLDRALRLASLTLCTAGSSDAEAHIPGLSPATAEALRERLLLEDWAHE